MSDNVTLPGTGAVVGADEVTIGAVLQQVQRVKLVDGTDGGTALSLIDSTGALKIVQKHFVGAGTIANTAQATVGTSAGSVVSAGTYAAVVLQNLGSVNIAIGASGVTMTSAFVILTPGDVWTFDPPNVPTNAIYAIAAAGSQTLGIGLMS